jgi:hypothetical protein
VVDLVQGAFAMLAVDASGVAHPHAASWSPMRAMIRSRSSRLMSVRGGPKDRITRPSSETSSSAARTASGHKSITSNHFRRQGCSPYCASRRSTPARNATRFPPRHARQRGGPFRPFGPRLPPRRSYVREPHELKYTGRRQRRALQAAGPAPSRPQRAAQRQISVNHFQ